MDPTLKIAFIAAASAIAGGLITGIIAPHVAWGIEKKREKLKARRAIIERCRVKIEDASFTKQSFRTTLEYQYIRPYLQPKEVDAIEKDNTIMVGQHTEDSWNPYRKVLIRAIEKLEKDWDLI